MRKIDIHKIGDCKVDVIAIDKPGAGGANHSYELVVGNSVYPIDFQKGAINEVGNNGVTNEALIAIVIDRLEGFQKGPTRQGVGEFACRENAIALTKLEEALLWLQKRTRDRMARGVEGRSIA
jgi:hypothetical protein